MVIIPIILIFIPSYWLTPLFLVTFGDITISHFHEYELLGELKHTLGWSGRAAAFNEHFVIFKAQYASNLITREILSQGFGSVIGYIEHGAPNLFLTLTGGMYLKQMMILHPIDPDLAACLGGLGNGEVINRRNEIRVFFKHRAEIVEQLRRSKEQFDNETAAINIALEAINAARAETARLSAAREYAEMMAADNLAADNAARTSAADRAARAETWRDVFAGESKKRPAESMEIEGHLSKRQKTSHSTDPSDVD